MKYYNQNKKKLEAMEYEDYRKNFDATEAMLEDLTELAGSNKVKYNNDQYNSSRDLIKLHLKAQIARRVWDNEGFYPIFNETHEILNEALKQFDLAERLARN